MGSEVSRIRRTPRDPGRFRGIPTSDDPPQIDSEPPARDRALSQPTTNAEEDNPQAESASREDTPGSDGSPSPSGIRSGALAGRSLSSAILILAVPVLVQQLLQAFVGMTDKLFAGHLDEGVRLEALDAIGIGSYVTWFVGIALSGLGIGGQAIIARAMGAGDRDEAQHALGQALGVSVAWGAAVGVILWTMAAPLAVMTKLGPEASELLRSYLRVLAVSMPAAGVMHVGAMCLQGAGDMRRPAVIAIGVNVVNVGMSWVLSGADIRFDGSETAALVNPFSFDLGVTGIAAGSAIGYGFGALATWWVLVRGVKDLALRRSELRPRRAMLTRFLRIGVPSFAEGISMWAVNLFVLAFIGIIARDTVGSDAGLQGAHIIAIQWESFSFLPGFAIGMAAGTLAGQYVGAGEIVMARRAIAACVGIAALMMGTFGVVFMVFGEELTRVISTEPIHVETVPGLLFVAGMSQVFLAVTMVTRQGLRGVGDTRWCFVITTFSSYCIRLPLAYLLGVYFELGLVGIWYGLCGEFLLRGVMFMARFLHGGWARVRV